VSVPINNQGAIARASRDGRPETDDTPDPVRGCSGVTRGTMEPIWYVPNAAHDIVDGAPRACAVVLCVASASAPETITIPATTSVRAIFRETFMDITPSFWTLPCHQYRRPGVSRVTSRSGSSMVCDFSTTRCTSLGWPRACSSLLLMGQH